MIFIATSSSGQARAKVVSADQCSTLEPILEGWIGSKDITLMADGSTSYLGIGAAMEEHHRVIHSQLEYANPESGAHVNKAEAVIAAAKVGVYHNLDRKHLQRYLDEIVWRWNHRDPVREVVKTWTTKTGVELEKTTKIWKPTPVVNQIRGLPQGAVGKQLRRSENYGLCWP